MIIEICATSVQSARNAQEAGAHRIELCSELAVGGITPSYGFLLKIREKIDLPIQVLIRPRSGNFVYSDEELETMIQDIEFCKDLGCDGIVSGVLNPDFKIDTKRTQELIRASSNMNFTFHRAFDLTPDPFESLNQLMELKVNRILTSGQASSAEKGIEVLKELQTKAGDQLTILPGGGIHPDNIRLFKENGFKEIHASASGILSESQAPKISMNSEKFWDETRVYVSDKEIIKRLKFS
jgi:copper homeostasis protein